MDEYLDYNSVDAALQEEERKRREAEASVMAFEGALPPPDKEGPGFFDRMATAYGQMTGMPSMRPQTMPAPQSGMTSVAPQPAGVAPVGYGMGAGQPEPDMMPVAPQQAQPQQPSSYDAAALAAIRQKESSNNYNVGQHPGSSAWGAYGITNDAYTDIQNRDPYFAGRDRATLSPEEQDRAALTLRDINDGYLRDKGVPVNEPNRQLAHFFGAGGAGRYLNDGYISPEAAAANGGYERTRQIAEERLALGRQLEAGQGPAVAAVGYGMGENEPQYGGGDNVPTVDLTRPSVSDEILSNANATVEQLASIISNPDASKLSKQTAIDRISKFSNVVREGKKAAEIINNPTPKNQVALAEALKKNRPEGNMLRAIGLSMLGMKDLAAAEFEKFGVGTTNVPVMIDGKSAMIELGFKGNAIQGVFEDGTKMTADQLSMYGKDKQRPEIGSTTYMNKELGIGGRVVTKINNGKTQTFIESGGKLYNFDDKWKPTNELSQLNVAGAKKVLDLQFAGPIAYNEASAKMTGEFNTKNNANVGYRSIAPGQSPVLVDFNNDGQPVIKNSNGSIRVVPNAEGRVDTGGGNVGGGQSTIQSGLRNPYRVEPSITNTQKPTATDSQGIPGLPDMKKPSFQEPGFENESMGSYEARSRLYNETMGQIAKGRTENIIAAEKPIVAKNMMNVQNARQIYDLVKPINEALQKSTGSGFGAGLDKALEFFGQETEGSKAIAQLQVLGTAILMNVPRFEGPQSDRDTATYKEAAGRLADPKIPRAVRLAAFKTIMEINKKYAPDLDWNYKSQDKGGDVDTDLVKRFGG